MLKLPVRQYPAHTEPAFVPAPPTSWFAPLSIPPVLQKRGLRASEQQALVSLPPNPLVSFSWFAGLSEPKRFKPGVRAAAQPFFFYGMNPTTITPFAWYAPLSEPKRFKRGLHSSRQQFLAAPSRLLPTPTIFGSMNATETKDTFLAGAREFNRPVAGELGVQELDRVGEMSVSTQSPPVSARMSIQIQ